MKITENRLKRIIKESVKNVLREDRHDIYSLPSILEEMANYAQQCIDDDDDSVYDYFNEIVETGLFHDAVGKVTGSSNGSVTFSTDY